MNDVLQTQLKNEKQSLIQYLKIKTDSQDWHAVADAAMDLREIEAKLSILMFPKERDRY